MWTSLPVGPSQSDGVGVAYRNREFKSDPERGTRGSDGVGKDVGGGGGRIRHEVDRITGGGQGMGAGGIGEATRENVGVGGVGDAGSSCQMEKPMPVLWPFQLEPPPTV